MEYKINLKVSDSELYYTLIQSMLGEAKQATGKEVTVKDLKGGYKYKYRKSFGKKSVEVTTHIKEPITNKRLELRVERIDNQYSMIYDLKPIDKFETELTYSQQDAYKVKNIFQKWKFKRSMKKKFKMIEKYIVSNRAK